MRKLKLDADSVKVQTLEMAPTPQITVLQEATTSYVAEASGCAACWTSQELCY